jgi:hypothetical protein
MKRGFRDVTPTKACHRLRGSAFLHEPKLTMHGHLLGPLAYRRNAYV